MRVTEGTIKLKIGEDGTEVLEWVGELLTGHWHYRQIGTADEDGLSLFEATWIKGAKACDDCVPS